MAPAEDAHAGGVHGLECRHRPVAGGHDVVHLEAAVVDRLVVLAPVAGRAAVLGGHDHVALLHQLADDVRVVGAEVAVDAPVRQEQERALLRRVRALRDEDVRPHAERVPRVRDAVGLLLLRRGDGRDVDLVDLGHVADPVEPEDVVDLLLQLLEGERLGLDLPLQRLDLAGEVGGRDLLGHQPGREASGRGRRARGRGAAHGALSFSATRRARPQVPVGEVEVLLPVVGGERVLAGAEVVADRAAHRAVGRRQVGDAEAVPAEQAVDGLGRLRRQELPARVGPEVLGRARDVERPRGDEREQHRAGPRAARPRARRTRRRRGANQCGKALVMRSVVSPKRRRASAAPPSPESFETTRANRSSEAPAHRAVFPSRECPMTATRPPSTSGSFARHVERAAEAPGPGADRPPVVGTEAAGGARADPGPHAASPAVGWSGSRSP